MLRNQISSTPDRHRRSLPTDPTTNRWVPLLDSISWDDWNLTGVISLATDSVNPNNVYIAAGTYTNSGQVKTVPFRDHPIVALHGNERCYRSNWAEICRALALENACSRSQSKQRFIPGAPVEMAFGRVLIL